MKSKIVNYLIVIEPDKRTSTGNACYSVYCPILGLADSGDTIEEAIFNMKQLITFHLECLKEEAGYKDFMFSGHSENSIITTAKVRIPA